MTLFDFFWRFVMLCALIHCRRLSKVIVSYLYLIVGINYWLPNTRCKALGRQAASMVMSAPVNIGHLRCNVAVLMAAAWRCEARFSAFLASSCECRGRRFGQIHADTKGLGFTIVRL